MYKTYILALLLIVASCAPDKNIVRFESFETSVVLSGDFKNLESADSRPSIINLGGNVSEQRFNEAEIIDTMIFVPLETTRNSLFYGIKEIKMSDDRIFISDVDGHLLIFNSEGAFIKQLRKGQGPGEIYKLWDFTYDTRKETLIVYQSDNLSYYDKNGNFLFDQRCPIMFMDFCATDTGFVFFQPFTSNYHLREAAGKSVLVTDNDLRLSNIGLEALNVDSRSVVTSDAFIVNNDESIVVSQLLNDTIYQFENSSLGAKYILHYDSSINVKDDNQVRSSSGFYHMGGYLENDKAQFFKFWSPRNGLCVVYRDKKTGNAAGGKRAFGAGFSIPHYCFDTKAVYNDYFVSSFNPQKGCNAFSSQKISEESKQRVKDMTEDDNPVVVLFKIKIE